MTKPPLDTPRLRCYCSRGTLTPEQVANLLPHPLQELWNTPSSSWLASAVLALDNSHLHFHGTAVGTPELLDEPQPNGFVEGLWKADVFELFLGTAGSSCYLEINLAPGGSWWCQRFVSYRKRDVAFRPPTPDTVQTRFQSEPERWSVHLKLPLTGIPPEIQFDENTRANFCAILGSAPRHYCSLASIDSKQPDFHLSASLLPIELLSLP